LNDELETLLPRALQRDPAAAREFVDRLIPVVHARVARVLARDARAKRARSEVDDLTQDVLVSLLENDGRALRAWDPARGRSLASFVSLLADHAAVSILRSSRRTPWREEPAIDDEIEAAGAEHPGGADPSTESVVASRQMLTLVAERLRSELTPRGLELFALLVVEERPVAEVCDRLSMKRDAVYAWRYRLAKLASRLVDEFSPPSSGSPVGRV
jgi:RNA polymerase sigma-70 factor (ECF subfamily)